MIYWITPTQTLNAYQNININTISVFTEDTQTWSKERFYANSQDPGFKMKKDLIKHEYMEENCKILHQEIFWLIFLVKHNPTKYKIVWPIFGIDILTKEPFTPILIM